MIVNDKMNQVIVSIIEIQKGNVKHIAMQYIAHVFYISVFNFPSSTSNKKIWMLRKAISHICYFVVL